MSNFIHGNNLEHKIRNEKNLKNIKLLREIADIYGKWKEKNMQITKTTVIDIERKVKLLNDYKIFIDQAKFKKEAGNKYGFTSQSQLHSSVLEEFMYYLFKDIGKLNVNIR